MKQLTERMDAQEAELNALKAERDQLKAEVSSPKTVSGISIITKAEGLDAEGLFLKAAESLSFVSYGAVAEAIGLGERFLPSMMGKVIAFIEGAEVDHLVVNRKGQFGAGAPLADHQAKLKELGYEVMPEQGQRRKAKGKSKAGVDVDLIAKVTAAVMASMSN